MNKNERIILRDEIFSKFKEIGIIDKLNHFLRTKISKIDNNYELQEKWNLYVSEFRSKEEAIYCIIHLDDYENHKCPVCNNISDFCINHRKFYTKTCGNSKCIGALANSDSAKQKAIDTCMQNYGVSNVSKLDAIKQKKKDTYNKNHPKSNKKVKPNSNLTTEEKKKLTNLNNRNVEYPSQDPDVRRKSRETNLKKRGVEYAFQQHIQHYDIWHDNDKFINYVKEQYELKKSFLTVKDIRNFFSVKESAIRKRIRKLEITNYFYMVYSSLELDFKSFLNTNSIQFKKNDKSILRDDKNKRKEIDFLCGNIGFEINDIATHNSMNENNRTYKHPTYHLEKTLLAQQNGIKLIHIWEWELRTESIWNKLSKWILNQLNSNKISIDVNQCTICEIDLTEAKQFFELYDINNFKECDHYIGVYYQNDLICMLLINTTGEAHITLKYNYILYDKQKLLLDYCKRMNMNRLIAYCDLSKDYGDELKHLGFKLTNLFEPNIIWCNKEMEIFKEQYSNCVSIYNCGYNIFELIDESEENPYNV